MNGSEPLSPADSTRLVEFARACKAAARAVSLYPDAHPAIAATMARLVELTAAGTLPSPLRLTITGKSLRLDGKRPVKPDPVVTELAMLLYDYAIGELIVQGGATLDDWRHFLRILRRTPDAVRTGGGIARLLADAAPSHVDVREIDYAQLLRERGGLSPADWEDAIAACLVGRQAAFNADLSRKLLEAVEKGALGELVTAANLRGDDDGISPATQADGILALAQAIVEAAGGADTGRAAEASERVSQAFSELSPKVMLALAHLRTGHAADGDAERESHGSRHALADRILKGMREETIAHFLAQNVMQPDLSTTRLAQAFQALVQDTDQRERLLTLAHDEAAASPAGRNDPFEELWNRVSGELRTYSDRPFVSEAYARELTRAQTVAVEQVHDDPPERVRGWLDSVATFELRGLDLMLVNDLLRLEQDEERRMKLMPPVVALVDDLLLVGDLDPVERLIAAAAAPDRTAPSRSASHALTLLASGRTVRHVTSLLAGADDAQATRLRALCLSLGAGAVEPLVEALSAEDRTRVRERLTRVVDAFGAPGREALDRLKASPSAAIRRTVLHLQREFGDAETLPDAGPLASDENAQARREGVRTIVASGTDRAYRIFEQALAAATPAARDALMQAVAMLRDDRATGLYAYLVARLDHRGPLSPTYQRAIQALGASKNASAIPALESALYRGEWWAPGRTATLRETAAAALTRIGTAEAFAVLEKSLGVGAPAAPERRALAPEAKDRGARKAMTGEARLQRGVELVRRLAAALRSSQLYSPDHPIIARNLDQLLALIGSLLSEEPDTAVVVGVLGEKIIVGDLPLGESDSHGTMIRRLKRIGVERLTLERGVTRDELAALINAINTIDPASHPASEPPAFPALPHVRVGRVTVDRDEEAVAVDMAAYRRLYTEAVTTAETVWQSARLDGQPDSGAARTMVDGLAEAVSQNRTALLALTTLKEYDNYTFTHMVNVSLLTMGQARGLGIDGPLLREFGLAALMHDIGKVRIPLEILNKPEKLSNDEFEIMKSHTILGAEMLRGTPDIPTLAPVVAFEHHLRLDGSGYPAGIRRQTLNLGTTLCSIADVYDAMRSQRKYQQAFPTERILAVLQNEGQQFDHALVRRFVQLLGIYPTGTLVRLDTGELAVVTEPYAPDPHRPEVRLIEDRHGQPLDPPRMLSLWAAAEGEPRAIVAPVDPRQAGIDPLPLIDTRN